MMAASEQNPIRETTGWVTLAECFELIQAQAYAAALRGAGIPVVLPDEHLFSNYPVLSHGSTGCRIWVLEKDIEDALGIIRGIETVPPAYPCPKCGGESRRLKSWTKTAAMTWIMLVSGPPGAYPFAKRKRVCEDCQHRFDPGPAQPFDRNEHQDRPRGL